MTIQRYRKLPVTIETICFDGTTESAKEILDWILDSDNLAWIVNTYGETKIVIGALEGDVTASPGDWVIKGIQNEFYPCKPDIFEKTYELEY